MSNYYNNNNPSSSSFDPPQQHTQRTTQRRQREDAWHNEQDQHAFEGGNNDNHAQYGSTGERIRTYDPNRKVVHIGVNRDHHAPFLPATNNNSNNNEDNTNNSEDSTSNSLTSKHRALVWPAKDPNGPLATSAIKGSSTMKEHRKRKVQKTTVRSKVLNSAEDNNEDENDDDAKTQKAMNNNNNDDDKNTEADDLNTNPNDDEGGDEDSIATTTTTTTKSNKHNNNSNNNSSDNFCGISSAEQERLKIKEQRERLPAFKVRDQFIEAVRENQILVVQGETGSGKSTQLPQYLLEERFASRDTSVSAGIIGCTQPRRVAAIGLARRVSQEVGCEVGDLVGYAVRLEDETTVNTRLKFMTDGVLLREAVLDPLLWKYNVLVLDEAHERSIDTDVLLGVVKRILKKRRDFRLVLMSATMQIDKFSNFFGGAPIFEVSGRTFPVSHIYSPSVVEDYVQEAVLQVLKVHVTAASIDQKLELEEKEKEKVKNSNDDENSSLSSSSSLLKPTGDILVFMTGEEDVKCVCDLVRERVNELEQDMEHKAQVVLDVARQTGKPVQKQLKLKKLEVIPCFSTILVNKEQLDRVLNPPLHDPENTRKCIVATNVAETSLTIDGITVVIDCGFMKCKVFKPKMGAHQLLPFPVSKAQATQRAGRAGRTREGTCYRLYTQDAFNREMLEAPVPEIKRSSIDRVCLFVKAISIDDVENFDFIDPPPAEIIHKSLYSLWLLGALDDRGKLTQKGRQLAALPVEPAMGVVLLTSKDYHCSKECINIAAMLSVDTRALFAVPRDKEEEAMRARDPYVDLKSDHITLFNILTRFLHEAEIGGGEVGARRWAERSFLSFSVLKTASGIRDQLNEQVGKMLFSSKKNIDSDYGGDSAQQSSTPRRFQNALEATRFCIISGFFPHSAKRHKLGEYITILTNVPAQLPSTSALSSGAGTTAEFIVFNELAMTTERSFLSISTVAEPEWLVEASRGLFYIRGQQQQQNDSINNNNSVNSNNVPTPAAPPQHQATQLYNPVSAAASLLQNQMNKLSASDQQQLMMENERQRQQQQQDSAEANNMNNNNVSSSAAVKPKFVPRSMRKK